MENTSRANRIIRLIAWIAAEIFALTTIIRFLSDGISEQLLLALGTPFLLLIPMGTERLLRCRFALPLYLFTLLYTLGPMLGHCWQLYHLTNWWDKFLHISSGILFVFVGWDLYQKYSNHSQSSFFAALFSLCFSVSVAVVWEFFEFGADQLLGMDMQNDTILSHFSSYFLGNSLGTLGHIELIQQVVIDGIALPFSGYLDIGLHDTMWDMILESLGALVTACVCFFAGGTPLLRQHRQSR